MYLADIFTNHMVFQRNKEICVFGTGEGNGVIEFCGEKYEFASNTENFKTYLPPMDAGGPYEMTITLNGKTQIITDIMIGDVYLACGQSNMEFTLKESSEIEYFNNENIRFFTEPTTSDNDGNLIQNSSSWMICKGSQVEEFSAIGYYFAIELQKHTGVPIGIISCSKGASRVDAWTSPEYVNTDNYQQMIKVKHLDYSYYKFNHNSWTYKNKLLKIVPFANSGVLWYQGESNRCYEEALHYAQMLEIMIKNWRELWNCNLPFYCVQLMPYNESKDVSSWQIVRSQQELASKTIDDTFLITLVNTGESDEIHPKNKKIVAYALANAVRNKQFRADAEYSGPILEEYNINKNSIELIFSHSEGLHIKGDDLLDLYVYDKENNPLEINFELEENRLKIFWSNESFPTKIELGYNNSPNHNLYNSSNYLTSPFSLELN